MRLRPPAGLDFATGALLISGAGLVAASIVAAVVLLAPSATPIEPTRDATPTPLAIDRPATALGADHVATVLSVEAAAGASSAARVGDHVDILAFFPAKATGSTALTRVVLQDVIVLGVDRAVSNIALTLAVPRTSALLLQEAQALGGHPFVTLRPLQPLPDVPTSFSDSDLVARIAH